MTARVDFCDCWPEPCIHQPIVPTDDVCPLYGDKPWLSDEVPC